jgi:MoxR-like ATPase
MNEIDKLQNVLGYVKSCFVGKNEIVDLLGICLVAKENAFLLGPPGTAKSAIVRQLANCVEGGKNFEYLLTRFTEPNEIFGPFDIRKLKEGELITNTEGMLPEASMVFLDEIFNANSAILNSLLMALNERIFRRGKQTTKLPALTFIGASNVMPEDETLNALLDRFLVRMKCDYVNPDELEEVLLAGWKLNKDTQIEMDKIGINEIIELQRQTKLIDLALIRKKYIELIHNLRATGIKVSDRRAVKIQNLIAASAIVCKRQEAILSDLWVLKYIWDTEEQIEIIAGIVDAAIDKDIAESAHPQVKFNKMPNPEDLAIELQLLKNKINQDGLSYEEQNVIKDKLRYIQTRCSWIKNQEHKMHLNTEIDMIWQRILQTV